MENCFHCGLIKSKHRESDGACPVYEAPQYSTGNLFHTQNGFHNVNKFFAIPSSVEGFTTPMPRRTWLRHRINELLTAITQYVETDNCKSSIDHWIDELKKNIEEWNV